MSFSDAASAWDSFLDPDAVRMKLAYAGVFLVGAEMLKDAILRHPLDFFATEFVAPDFKPRESAEYQVEVRDRDPEGKRDRLRGSLAFLEHLGVLNAADISTYWRLNGVRNDLAHELSSLLMHGRTLTCKDHLPELVALLRKVETWWWFNVEVATDTDVSQFEISSDDVVPGSVLMFEVLVNTATGDDQAARAFYAEFRSRSSSGDAS